jgi:hypothetical protein
MHLSALPSAFLTPLTIVRKILGRLALFGEKLQHILPLIGASLALAAFTVLVLIPRRTVYLLLFVLALTTALYLINPAMATYSNHGMIHLGYLYSTERLDWPPEDPYFAGTSLHYHWAYDALVARLSRLLQVAPSWVFAGCNLAALAVSMAAVAGISKLLDGDRITANCAVVVTLLAPTFLGGGASDVFWPVSPVHDEDFWLSNGLPPVEKYTNVNAMPVGITLGLICILNILSIIKNNKFNIYDMIIICISILLVGFLYPPVWLSTCIVVLVCAALAVRAGRRGMALALAAALLIANLAVAPYLRDLTSGRSRDQTIRLLQEPRVYAYHFLHAAVILLPLWLLIAVRGRSLAEQLRRSWVHWAALGSGLALLLTFILMYAPADTTYKFRIMAVCCLGPLAGPGLKRIYDWNKTALVLILALQLLPYCADLYAKSPWGWGHAAEPCSWRGTVLRHDVPEEDHLYQWIREHTPTTAILIDNKPYVPVYAQRSLFVARHSAAKREDWWNRRDGWTLATDVVLQQAQGHPVDEVRRRNALVDALYSPTRPRAGANPVGELRELTKDRPVFVVARNEAAKDALDRGPFLQKVAEESYWAIYALEK